jgi:hypothetical protein
LGFDAAPADGAALHGFLNRAVTTFAQEKLLPAGV